MRWYRRLILAAAEKAETEEAKALRDEVDSLKEQLAEALDQRDTFERKLEIERKATSYWEMLYEKDFSEVVAEHAANSRRAADQERIGRRDDPDGPIAA